MQILGITGGMGSGKSTVCKVLELMGIPVFYADAEARTIVDDDRDVIDAIKNVFGDDVYQNNQLNRKALGDIVFRQTDLLDKLNGIVHPAVARRFDRWCLNYNQLPLLAKEAAILFESGAYRSVDFTLTVTAPLELRIQRIIKRDGLSRSQIIDRLNNQWPDERKMALSNFVVHCDETQLAIPQLLDVVQKILK